MLTTVVTPTHDPCYLREAMVSLMHQTHGDWRWCIVANHADGGEAAKAVGRLARHVLGHGSFGMDPRIEVLVDEVPARGVGGVKARAFGSALGDVLVELDHDDLLTPEALAEVALAFEDLSIGFVYSDSITFRDGYDQGPVPYTVLRAGWERSGFTFYDAEIEAPRPGKYVVARALPPTALSCSHIYTAPNHVRAWRASVYREVGGHDPSMSICDDHDLVCRSFLATRFAHIPKPLYLYRIAVRGSNTWLSNVDNIRATTEQVRNKYLEKLVLHQCQQQDLSVYDLGGAITPRPGWKTVDMERPADVVSDLRGRWPFADSSVGAFRASDFLEHLPDKQHTMSELHRCLVPGGWLLSMTPSTNGPGAWMDPTHVSYWNLPSFWYWTRDDQAKYIRNTSVRFKEAELRDVMVTIGGLPIAYTIANLVALK